MYSYRKKSWSYQAEAVVSTQSTGSSRMKTREMMFSPLSRLVRPRFLPVRIHRTFFPASTYSFSSATEGKDLFSEVFKNSQLHEDAVKRLFTNFDRDDDSGTLSQTGWKNLVTQLKKTAFVELGVGEENLQREIGKIIGENSVTVEKFRELILSHREAQKKALTDTAVLSASAAGELSKVEYYLEVLQLSPKAVDSDNRTALHVAAAGGHLEVVKYLISKGAEMNAVDRWNHTPLYEAKNGGHDNVVSYLSSVGSVSQEFPPSQDQVGTLIRASRDGLLQEVVRLVNSGVGIDVKDYDDRTPLHHATIGGHVEVVKFLLDKGADLIVVDRWGSTVLDEAIHGGNSEIIEFLRQRGCTQRKGLLSKETLGSRSLAINNLCSFYLSQPYTVTIYGCGYKGGQPIAGVEKAPEVLRNSGLKEKILNLGWKVNDLGDFNYLNQPSLEPSKNWNEYGLSNTIQVGLGCEALYKAVKYPIQQGHFLLNLGGDHSCAIGSITALAENYPNLGVIWVDAHADANTPHTSPSGNLHGMPLSFLLKLIDPTRIPGFKWMPKKAILSPDRVVYIGLRDVDLLEKQVVRDIGLKYFSMKEVDKYGIGVASSYYFPSGTHCLWVAFAITSVATAVLHDP
eukprot:TRINITY_DN1890_c0_g1_i21.p1 TRINITY_DN1890_c0_g1~~TRINITY_DN1890_c0_g1_i21.p1  ORF type:complete len:626 (-),score=107.51 TRINITY_DN1890_c0_g1_i21:486-2363(-)